MASSLSPGRSIFDVFADVCARQYTLYVANMSWGFARCLLPDFSAIISLGWQAMMRWLYSHLGDIAQISGHISTVFGHHVGGNFLSKKCENS